MAFYPEHLGIKPELALTIVYTLAMFFLGDFVLSLTQSLKRDRIHYKIATSLPLGFAINIFIAHCLAFITHSYKQASILTLSFVICALIYLIFSKKYSPIKDVNFKKSDLLIIITALLIAISCGIRGNLTDSDNTHIAWDATLVNNNIYPPLLPPNKEIPLTFYHFGIDLSVSSIISNTGAEPWNAISIQVGIGTFMVFMALFVILETFIHQFPLNFICTLFSFFYTSILGIEFFYKYFKVIHTVPLLLFFKHWQNASLPAIGHLPYYAVLISQNLSMCCMFVLIILALRLDFTKQFTAPVFIPFLFCSFLSNFSYPGFWYPTIAGFALYFFFWNLNILIQEGAAVFKSPIFRNSLMILFCFAIGKYLSGSGSYDFSGVKAFVFAPSMYWDHFAMQFLSYFDTKMDGISIKPVTDFVSGKTIPNVHLFTLTTFRNFGFLTIIATIITIYKVIKKDFDKSLLFYAIAILGLLVPFLFDFIIKPTETYRFPGWSNILLLIFTVVSLVNLLNKGSLLNRIVGFLPIKLVIIFNLLLTVIPGVISILPIFGYFDYLPTDLLNKQQKAALLEMAKIHKTGDVALTTVRHYCMNDIVAVAGYYGVGGQMHKTDDLTRKTGIFLFNPVLLQELKVDYVLVQSDDKVSPLGIERLSDVNLFQEIQAINNLNPKWRFYKFINKRQ